MTTRRSFKYRAFLSYSHRDEAWGKWLHKGLEGYRVDKELVGRETALGPVPASLRPIFRDREEFSAGHSLSAQTLAALDASQFIVVLCSPNAVRSAYVNEEILRFKAMGRSDRVVAVIVDGEPGDPDRECFPQALRFIVDDKGALTDAREEPIAADVRPQGDGRAMALQKVVAGLLGVGLDEIVRRAERARRRQVRIRNSIIAALVGLAVTTAGGLTWARFELSRNDALLDRTLQRATGLVGEATARSDQIGFPRALTLRFLEQAEALFKDMAELGRETPALRYRKAWMMTEFARSFALLGNTNAQRERANGAHALMRGLAASEPGNLSFQRDLAITHAELGHVFKEQGRLDDALGAQRSGLAIFERLTRAQPQNADWQFALAVFHDRVGELLMARGELTPALAAYHVRHSILAMLVAEDADNAVWQRELSASYNRVGELYRMKGSLGEALKAFRSAHEIRERLARADPQNAALQFSLGISHERIGDALLAQGAVAAAAEAYRARHDIVVRLAAGDPSNVQWQRDLSVSHGKLGDAHKAAQRPREAIGAYRSGLSIARRLADADPANAAWQFDLGIGHERIGDMLLDQGDWAGALEHYNARHAIITRLGKAAPGNAIWLHDLSVSHEKIGDAMKVQRRFSDALKSYRDSLAIREHLSSDNPDNAAMLRDVSISHEKIGDILLTQDDLPGALKSFNATLEIRWKLAAADDSNLVWRHDLAGVYNNICWTHALLGNSVHALATCNESLRIRPNDANTLGSRGLVHLKAKVFDRAAADFEAAVRLAPKVAFSLYGLGIAKRALDAEGGGRPEMAAAAALQPDIGDEFARYGVR